LGDGTKVSVCKPFFASTLGISQRTVGSWVKNFEKNVKIKD
jgi:DNA-binding transcriptional regulator YiaG